MRQTIDCLLIGYNEISAQEFADRFRAMGTESGAYRDFNLNFIRYENKIYSLPEIFNLFYGSAPGASIPSKPLRVGETFSAAIAYLGTWLHRHGLTFDYVNAFRDEQGQLKAKLQQENILFIGIITTLYVSVFPIAEIVDFCRTYNRTAKIIVGGPFISTQVRTQDETALQYILETVVGADYYVNSSRGETELVKIIKALKHDLPLSQIDNIYYKKEGSGYVATPNRPQDTTLSGNMVNWDLFASNAGTYVNVRTAISCPFACAFCGFPQHAGKYQTAEVAEIEKELDGLARIGRVKSIFFVDDTFNVPLKRFKEILRMLIKNDYNFAWHSYFRCQYADPETVRLMRDSGCEGVFLGIESGSVEILKNMNKSVHLDEYRRGIELLKENGIVTYGNFIVGFPGETEETVQDTVDFIRHSGLDFFRAQLWYCEPITPVWNERARYDLQGQSFEWRHATMDSQKASDLIDRIFLSVDDPVWVPQYHFDFDSLWHLKQRGMNLSRIKELLTLFNRGIRERLRESGASDVSVELIKQLRDCCLFYLSKADRQEQMPPHSLHEDLAAFDL
jgi:anaerobic magnesium-protoporphyrin IX monomethyl ester cyclase